MLRAVFSRGASRGVSSLSARVRQKPAKKKLRLIADCELILYGTTESDDFVAVAGRKVNLKPDGAFSTSIALPDGKPDLPVRAMSKDETETGQMDIIEPAPADDRNDRQR